MKKKTKKQELVAKTHLFAISYFIFVGKKGKDSR